MVLAGSSRRFTCFRLVRETKVASLGDAEAAEDGGEDERFEVLGEGRE
jgi:hypothetical protein